MTIISEQKKQQMAVRWKRFRTSLVFLSIAVFLHLVLVLLFHPVSYHSTYTEVESHFTRFIESDSPELFRFSYDMYYNDPEVLIHPSGNMGFNNYRTLETVPEIPQAVKNPVSACSDILTVPNKTVSNFVFYEPFNGELQGYQPLFAEQQKQSDYLRNDPNNRKLSGANYPLCLDMAGNVVPADFSGIGQKFPEKGLKPSVYQLRHVPYHTPESNGHVEFEIHLQLISSSGDLNMDRTGKNILTRYLQKSKVQAEKTERFIILWHKLRDSQFLPEVSLSGITTN